MATIPKSQITPTSDGSGGTATLRESRTKQITRGAKTGLIKGTVDQLLEQVAAPIAALITPKLHELHPGLSIADKAVQALIEFAVLNVVAEILSLGGPMVSKIPGLKISQEEAIKRTAMLADWMRNYSGEKVGEGIADAAAELIPLVAGMLSDIDIGNILNSVEGLNVAKEEVVEEHAAMGRGNLGRPVGG